MKKAIILLCLLALSVSFVFANGNVEASAADEQVYLFKYAHTQSPEHPRSKSMNLFMF